MRTTDSDNEDKDKDNEMSDGNGGGGDGGFDRSTIKSFEPASTRNVCEYNSVSTRNANATSI